MRVFVNTPVLDGNEKKYLMDCIDTGWISSSGAYIERFENGMADFLGRKRAISVCNGTAALEAALQALNLPKGTEVIMPDFTIISCAQAIVKAGLVPVPVDCRIDTWNMDVAQIERNINEKTKAIMVVHIYGLPTDMDPVYQIAKKYNLLIIEDAAEAHGLTYRGKQCGSLGDVSIFSFFPNKHITCGEGGMIVTDNDIIGDRSAKIRNLFFDAERRYIHEEIGSNYRMTNMQAAIGLAQLEKINWTVKRKREIGRIYQEGFASLRSVQLPLVSCDYADNIYWVFGMVIKDKDVFADEVMAELKQLGVETRHFFYPMHKQPALVNGGYFGDQVMDEEKYVNANYICEHGFYIPSGLGLTIEEQQYVIEKVKAVLG